ncbi:MAG TPA: lysylphosphatidylglycerol synthase transmembrane domain-containing protein [Phycisphaerae bacterium]|nr:lysylphosphatidylglycerol synthase transmembrane domain-containing protein [Phycisphaerae bacterium]
MKVRNRILLITLKVLLAAALLGWVLSKAHWNDYIVSADGTSHVCRGHDANGGLLVSQGMFDNTTKSVNPAAGGYKPIVQGGSEYIHKGLKSILIDINLWVLILAAVIYFVGLVLVGIRWWWLVRLQKLDMSLFDALSYTFLGLFFNYVIPGTIGGDLVKALYASKRTKHTAVLLVTIFTDRIIGIGAMAMLAIIMLGWVLLCGNVTVSQVKPAIIAISIISAIIVCGIVFVLSPKLRRMLFSHKLFSRMVISKHFEHAGNALNEYRRHPLAMICNSMVGLMVHLTVFGSIALIGHSLLPNIPVYRYFIYLPIIYIIGVIPLTPGGVGFIESMYVEFLAPTAAAVTGLFAVSLLARIIPIILSLPGLLVAVKGPKISTPDKLERQLEMAEELEDDKRQQ